MYLLYLLQKIYRNKKKLIINDIISCKLKNVPQKFFIIMNTPGVHIILIIKDSIDLQKNSFQLTFSSDGISPKIHFENLLFI